jgi:hypothetical protein
LRIVASNECAACHSDRHVMEASARKGTELPATAFQIHKVRPMQVAFELPRPPNGYTSTFASFWSDHPEFQLQRDHARDVPRELRERCLRAFHGAGYRIIDFAYGSVSSAKWMLGS